MLCGISKSCPYLVRIVTLNKSTGRTYSGTLTAGDTGSITESKIEGLSDAGVDTAVVCTDYSNVLLVTCGNASTAKDTLVVISYKVGSRLIELVYGLEAFECCRIYTVFKAELLELTVG